MASEHAEFEDLFAEEPAQGELAPKGSWKMLVVDDEPAIHEVTRLALKGFSYEGLPLEILGASSAEEAIELLNRHADIAVALIDVVMETPDAGLNLVRHIREDQGNRTLCIVLRTGQPGYAPEQDTIIRYPINDYRLKTDLTADKLFALTHAWLRQYQNMMTAENYGKQLEREVEDRTRQLALAKEHAEAGLEVKNRFLNNISHSFRTPLNAVIGFSGLLLTDSGLSDQQREFLNKISNSGKLLLQMVTSLLELARLERGEVPLNHETFELMEMLRQATDRHAEALEKKSLAFSLEVNDSAPNKVVADRQKLTQVISELVENACKFTDSGHVKVRVQASSKEPGCCLLGFEVEDTGCGVPEALCGQLFESLEQLPSHHNIKDGVGIGLALCQHYVHLMGGTIWIESVSGQGSTFFVKVPVTLN